MIMQETKHDFDVAILGNGLSGSMLATILGKKGVSVVLIDAEQHPRFAVGESTIPHTSLIISILAEKYDLPELDDLVDASASPSTSPLLAASSVTSVMSITARARFTMQEKVCNSAPVLGTRITGSARISTLTFTTLRSTTAPCPARKPESLALRSTNRG